MHCLYAVFRSAVVGLYSLCYARQVEVGAPQDWFVVFIVSRIVRMLVARKLWYALSNSAVIDPSNPIARDVFSLLCESDFAL